MIRAVRASALAWPLLVAAPLAAQEPPAHLVVCTTDAAARHFLEQVRYLLAAGDSASETHQRALGLSPVPADSVSLVTQEPVCALASTAFAASAAAGRGLPPPFPVAVVQAGDRMLVRLGGAPGPGQETSEVVVFDAAFRRLAGFELAS